MEGDCIYEPTERQAFFHSCDDDYIVVSGSRGSGKSLCCLIEVLGLAYESHIKGYWQALVIRRTIPQLQELLTRAKDLYPKIINGIKFNSQKNIFEFPNGSFIQFASCERDEDIEKFRGREFNMIFIDEGSHFDTDYCWNWLKSCNRNSHGYPNRMLLSTNPGPMWIKKMCKINERGEDTFQKIEYYDETSKTRLVKRLRFIQMNLESNHHMPIDYRASLAQDELNRDAFLFGLWKNPKILGQVLSEELDRFDLEGRLRPLTREIALPIHVFTDIGYSDNTSLIFCQFVGNNIHILNYYENSQCGVDDYIAVINKLYGDNALVHLPHDASKTESSGETVRQYWEKRCKVAYDAPNFQGNLPRLSNTESMNRVKAGFSRIYVDDNEANRVLMDHLRMYRRKWIETLGMFTDPIHDVHSHAFDALKGIFHYQQTTGYNWASYKPSTSGRRSY